MNRSSTPEAETPSGPHAVLGRRGVTIPWAWLTSALSMGGLFGALGHSAIFGAPPAFASTQEAHGRVLERHEEVIHELHEDAAVTKQQLHQLVEDVKYIRDHMK